MNLSWRGAHGSIGRVCPPTCWVCVCVCVYIYIYIAFYFLLKYCTDGPMVIVDYRNMKLILNKGSCVPDSKRYVFTQCKNTTENTPFHFTLCIQCAEYRDRKRVYKGMMPHVKRIIYTFLKLHLPECIQPKQSLAPPPPNFSEPPTDSLLQPRNCFIFFHVSTLPQNIVQSPLWFFPKASNIFVTSYQQLAVSASCRQ